MSHTDSLRPAPASGVNRRGLLPPCYPYEITTALGLIEALGGARAAADYTCTSPEKVYSWAVSGHIPTGWHLRLFAKVLILGKTINPTVFGFDGRDEEVQALARLMMGGSDA